MPMVNGKEYAYTPKGIASAKKAMKRKTSNKNKSSSKVAGSFNTSNKSTDNIKA